MKHKFGLNLPPLRIPSKAENRALRELLQGLDNLSPLSPPLSPYIDRRPLDLLTEAQLKLACAAIVKGEYIEPETKLNFKPLHATKRVPQPNQGPEEHQSRPHTSNLVSSQQAGITARSYSDISKNVTNSKGTHVLGQPDHARRPHDSRQHLSRRTTNLAANAANRPRTAPLDESDVSYSTPTTGSTDFLGNASTAMTSAAMSPANKPRQMSHPTDAAMAATSATIRESDKRAESNLNQKYAQQSQKENRPSASTPTEQRSGFRNWMRSERRNFLRPNTAVIGSLASKHGSQQDLSRIASSCDPQVEGQSSEAGEQQSRVEDCREDLQTSTDDDHQGRLPVHKSKINLNRSLPPLPSIHTWRDHQDDANVHAEPAPIAVQSPTLHLAHLIKSDGPHSALVRTSETPGQLSPRGTAGEATESTRMDTYDVGRKYITHSDTSSHDSCFSPAMPSSRVPSRNVFYDAPETLRNMSKSSTSLHQQVKEEASHNINTGSSRRTTHSSVSSSGIIPNFSRKISLDINGSIRVAETQAELTALPVMPRKDQPKGLRKVLSRFDISQPASKPAPKKENKALTWMDVFEAEGIKTGVMIQRPTAGMPIVRY